MRVYVYCGSDHDRRLAAGLAMRLGPAFDVIVPDHRVWFRWDHLLPNGEVGTMALPEADPPSSAIEDGPPSSARPAKQRRVSRRGQIILVSWLSAAGGRLARGQRLRSIVRFVSVYGWRELIELKIHNLTHKSRRSDQLKRISFLRAYAPLMKDERQWILFSRVKFKALYAAKFGINDLYFGLHKIISLRMLSISSISTGVLSDRRIVSGLTTALEALKIDAVVLFEDNIGNHSRFAAVAAQRAKLNYIVLPTTIPNPLEAAHYFAQDQRYRAGGLSGWIIRKLKPAWVFPHEGHDRLRLPVNLIALYEILGFATPRPWLLNFGQAFRIGVDSERIRRHHERLGYPSRQLITIGSAIDDSLFEKAHNRPVLRRSLLARLGLVDGRPLVLVAIPPDQYTAPPTSRFEYASYDEMLKGWAEAASRHLPEANIIAVRHPRSRLEDLKVISDAGIPFVDAATETVLPLCDVYVASISATIRWALALGIPVINYDCYRYRYGDYTDAAGVIEVDSAEQFDTSLSTLLNTPGRLDEMRARQSSESREWGFIDGGFAARLRALLFEAANRKLSS